MSDSRPLVAVYPGSFDPVTLGHEDIARRTLKIADRVVVAVARTSTQTKVPTFSLEERLEMLEEVFGDEARIECRSFEGLLVEFTREVGAAFVIRGLRAVSDFEYEFQMAQMNHRLAGVETFFVTTSPQWSYLSSALLTEGARFGGDLIEPDPLIALGVLHHDLARPVAAPAIGDQDLQ
jgi:pantetheine-phosphate adenylyltransferase